MRIPWGGKVTQALVSDKLWIGHVYLVVINRDRWEKLTQSERQAIQRAAESVYPLLGKNMDQHYHEMLSTLRKKGVKLRELTTAEVNDRATRSYYADAQKEWVAKKEQDGVTELNKPLQKLTTL